MVILNYFNKVRKKSVKEITSRIRVYINENRVAIHLVNETCSFFLTPHQTNISVQCFNNNEDILVTFSIEMYCEM